MIFIYHMYVITAHYTIPLRLYISAKITANGTPDLESHFYKDLSDQTKPYISMVNHQTTSCKKEKSPYFSMTTHQISDQDKNKGKDASMVSHTTN